MNKAKDVVQEKAGKQDSNNYGCLPVKNGLLMKEPFSIIIFGKDEDELILKLKYLLIKCGVCNFISGRLDKFGHCEHIPARPKLFVVSRASISSIEMESICAEAHRLSIPVLQL